MYKVEKTQNTNTNKAKSVLSSTGLRAISSVRRPLNRDSSFKNSVLSNTKNSSEKVEVSNRKALFTTPRTLKSKFEDTTPVVSKTRFSLKTVQSKSLDSTPVVSKTKIVVVTPLSAKHKVSSTFKLRDSPLSNYMKNKIRTSRMWQKWYELQPNVGWSPVKMPPNLVNSRPNVKTSIVDSGCSKHMMGDRSLLENFVEKFMGTVRFGSDHFAAITCYGDYVQGNITVCHVYYVEGLGHNLFSVGQFGDGDLEEIVLSHLNFGTINDLTKHDLVDGLPKFTYGKDHLCSQCKRGKIKKASYPPKLVPSNHSKLEFLHMDLCGPMRVASINEKRLPEFLWAEAISTACFTQNRLIIHTIYNQTPYELLHGRKPNVEYFHVFGSLCYPTNDRDDLGKMKPKVDIVWNLFFNDSSAEFMNIPSKDDLDNLFGPMYEEYFEKKSSEMSINFVAQQVHNHEDSPSTSLIIVEEHEAPPIVTTSEEQTSPISLNEANELNQEDSADFDGNTVFVLYDVLNFKEVESSTTGLDL
ncbi:integrase, catalytic region, zinc finger, CCHC-type containing protein [Tanacetum coccineum]